MWPCRCRRTICQARQNTRFDPTTYARPPKCKRCGKGLLRVDRWRMAHERRPVGKTCISCVGYHFPHRRGSKWCDNNPNLTPEMLEEREKWTN